MAEHLIRKAGGRYYFRRRVPVELLAAFNGKVEIQQALGTSDPKEAAKLVRKVSVETDAKFDAMRRALARPQSEGEKWPAFSQGETDDMEHAAYLNAHPEMSEEEEHAAYEKYKADSESASQAMRRAIRQILAENGLGDAFHRPLTPLLASAPASVPADNGNPAAGLIDLLRIWQRVRTPDSATAANMEMVISRFHESAGKHQARIYKRQHVIEFQAVLADMGLAPATIRKQISLLRALFATGQNANLLDDNVVHGVRTEGKVKAGAGKPPFSVADLNALFSSPVYVSNTKMGEPKERAKYWLPLLGLYTGARLEELGQLSPTDIRAETYRDASGTEQTAQVIYITNEGEGQGIKNNASYRRLPIHAKLIELGFLDYVSTQSGKRLFPSLTANKHGRETALYSRSFGQYLRNACPTIDKRKSFHSFRHLFKDVCREHGIEKDVRDAIQGHSEGDSAGDYGGQFYPLRPMVEAMAKYKVAGVKLPQ